jgi:hypothetical protein
MVLAGAATASAARGIAVLPPVLEDGALHIALFRLVADPAGFERETPNM